MRPSIFILLSSYILTSCVARDLPRNDQYQKQSPIQSLQTERTAENEKTLVESVLKNAYSEEVLAETIYTEIVAKYPTLSGISNIIDSEEKHSIQVGKLLDTRGIARPTDFGIYADTYATLSAMVASSLTGAIEAGVMIEVGDIDHLLTEYQTLSDTDIRQVFENIGGGSFNHLRAFLKLAEQYSYTPKTDCSRYLRSDELNMT